MKKWLKNYGPILVRNIISLITFIISIVIALLLIFGEVRDALFISSVLFLNIIIGIAQEIRVKLALEKLKALIIQTITRILPGGNEEVIPIEKISKKDTIKLQLGDQIPCDGKILQSFGLEANESLLTGESDFIKKQKDDPVFGGSIVVAGSALAEVTALPSESMISKMTDKIKQYDYRMSPIQKSTVNFIKYMSYALLVIVAILIVRGILLGRDTTSIIIEIAAISGTLVPEGLVLATTVLFSYGAVRMYQNKVLLQEINATEGLARIKNLCVDKTGTLTENSITVETVLTMNNYSENNIKEYIHGYISALNDETQSGLALKSYFDITKIYNGEIRSILPFSSGRKYGLAEIYFSGEYKTIVVGAPDILINWIRKEEDKEWLLKMIDQYSAGGKRLLLAGIKPENGAVEFNPENEIIPAALVVLHNPLRKGTKEIIDFLQEREVIVRVISGDNPKTVQAIAKEAGVKHTDKIILGEEIERSNEETLKEIVKDCCLFARVQPDHKERLIEIFKKDGFTAMIGDGANDALAIKKADLGIAMFEGAGALKQIAKVILLNSQFSAIPLGVKLADSIITTIEMVAGIFFNKVAAGLTLLFLLAIFGYTYPISPRNMTLVNYFTIGLPILFWGIFPAIKDGKNRDLSFLRKVVPVSALNGIMAAFASGLVFMITVFFGRKDLCDDFVVITYITLGFWYFMNIPAAFDVCIPRKQKNLLIVIGVLVIAVLFGIFNIKPLSRFFGIEVIPALILIKGIGIIIITGIIQYLAIKKKWAEKIVRKFMIIKN